MVPFSSGISAALGPPGSFVEVSSHLLFCPVCSGTQLCSKRLYRPNLFTKIPRASLNSFPVTGGFIISNIAYSQCVTGWESLVKLRFHSNRNRLSLRGSLCTLSGGFSLGFIRMITVLLVLTSH